MTVSLIFTVPFTYVYVCIRYEHKTEGDKLNLGVLLYSIIRCVSNYKISVFMSILVVTYDSVRVEFVYRYLRELCIFLIYKLPYVFREDELSAYQIQNTYIQNFMQISPVVSRSYNVLLC